MPHKCEVSHEVSSLLASGHRLIKVIEGLVMKPCHDNNSAAIKRYLFMLEGPRPYTTLCFNSYTLADRNISIGQFPLTHFKIYCGLCTVKAFACVGHEVPGVLVWSLCSVS